jgi:hypothetical protein
VNQRANARRNFLAQNQAQSPTVRATANRGRNFRGRRRPANRGNRFNAQRQNNNLSSQTRTIMRNPISIRAASMDTVQKTQITITRTSYADQFFDPVLPANFSAGVFDISPAKIPWLQQFCFLYTRYKINKFGWRYIAGQPLTTSGFQWSAFQARSTTFLPLDLFGVQQFELSHVGSILQTQSNYMWMPQHLNDRWFLTVRSNIRADDDDFVNTSPGRVILGTSQRPATQVSTPVGFLEVYISVTFADPQIFQDPLQPPTDVDASETSSFAEV